MGLLDAGPGAFAAGSPVAELRYCSAAGVEGAHARVGRLVRRRLVLPGHMSVSAIERAPGGLLSGCSDDRFGDPGRLGDRLRMAFTDSVEGGRGTVRGAISGDLTACDMGHHALEPRARHAGGRPG